VVGISVEALRRMLKVSYAQRSYLFMLSSLFVNQVYRVHILSKGKTMVESK
jgi:hypothetical protein